MQKQENEAQQKADKEYHRLRRLKRWTEEMCPPLYNETDLKRIPVSDEIISTVLDWKYGARGLILHGKTGLGKTRLAYQLLKRMYVDKDRTITTFDSSGFARECIAQCLSENGSGSWFERLACRDILFFDDFGKMKFTERVESELFSLFETRTAHKRPTILTTNMRGGELLAKMSTDRGEPFLRRLDEFFDTVTFELK